MKTFIGRGLKFDYPEGLAIKGGLPQIDIKKTGGGRGEASISLLRPEETFSGYYLKELDPNKLTEDFSLFVTPEFRRYIKNKPGDQAEYEILRSGNFQALPGAKELYFKQSVQGAGQLKWRILIPVGSRLITVNVALPEADSAETESIWAPLVSSFRADPEALRTLDVIDEVVKHGWRKPSTKARHARHELFAEYYYAALFDSRAKLFFEEDGDSSADLENIQESLREAGFFKRKKSLFWGQKLMPQPDLIIDFHLNAQPPADDSPDWAGIIDWGLDLNSGKLCFTCDEEPEIEFLLPKGVYNIRISMNGRNNDENPECGLWRIDLNSSPEKANNEVRIIK